MILVNGYMLKRVIIDRIDKSTAVTQSFTQGNLDVDMPRVPKSVSNDEIDGPHRSLEVLRKNLKNRVKH